MNPFSVLGKAIAFAFIIVLIVLFFIGSLLMLPFTVRRYMKKLSRLESALLRYKGQWVTAQKLRRASGLSATDLRELLPFCHRQKLCDVRRRDRTTCERVKRILKRPLPSSENVMIASTIPYFEFRYQQQGRRRRSPWWYSLRKTIGEPQWQPAFR